MTDVLDRVALNQFLQGAHLHPRVEAAMRKLVSQMVLSLPWSVAPGAGASGGTGTVIKSGIEKLGNFIKSSLVIDLTGLGSSTTDLDIIGTGTSAAYLGRILAADHGTVLGGRMTCLEVPATGVTDIDLYSATEATGVFDGGIAALAETALVTSGGAWTLGAAKGIAAPAANQYLYLTGGAAGVPGVYTAGRFLLEFFGYDA